MARSREGKDSEYYRGIIRELKKKIRSLEKQLKDLVRSRHIYEESQTDPEEIEPVQEVFQARCPECSTGLLESKFIMGRHWTECNSCNYRSKTTKV